MTEKTSPVTEEINIATDVLVIGGGFTGLKSASEIARLGYKAILIENNSGLGKSTDLSVSLPGVNPAENQDLQNLADQVMADSQIEVLTQTKLLSAAGMPGDFNIRLLKGNDAIARKVGAIVVATDFYLEALNEKYGLDLSEKVLTQSQIEAKLAADNKEKKKNFAREHQNIAFLVGLEQEGNPLVMERVLRSVLAIENIEGCHAYIYVNNVKVASEGLSRLYQEGRKKGALYFKIKDTPKISQNGKNSNISFYSPIVRRDVEFSPDLIVVEEAICADEINKKLAGILNIDLGPLGFLQNDNVHRFPVHSNREGIFVAGSSRDIQNLSWAWTDIENVVLAVKNLLGNGAKTAPKNKAVVDRGKCTNCLTCYRCCPHGAIYWDRRTIISPVACQACGICASECPMNAIQIGGYTDTDIKGQIRDSATSGNGAPVIIAFCCENSAFEAGEMAKAFKMPLPEGLHMIKVPCAGKIDLDYIMAAFVEGADGVLVMACHNKNCKSEKGNIYAGWRVDDAHRMFEEIGYDKGRLRFVTLASNMGSDFSSIAFDMQAKLKKT